MIVWLRFGIDRESPSTVVIAARQSTLLGATEGLPILPLRCSSLKGALHVRSSLLTITGNSTFAFNTAGIDGGEHFAKSMPSRSLQPAGGLLAVGQTRRYVFLMRKRP